MGHQLFLSELLWSWLTCENLTTSKQTKPHNTKCWRRMVPIETQQCAALCKRWGSFVFAKPSPRPQSIFSCKTFAITLYNTENLGYSINFTVMSLFQVSFQVPPSSPHSAKVISSLLPPEASPEYWPTAATIGKSCSHIVFFAFFNKLQLTIHKKMKYTIYWEFLRFSVMHSGLSPHAIDENKRG